MRDDTKEEVRRGAEKLGKAGESAEIPTDFEIPLYPMGGAREKTSGSKPHKEVTSWQYSPPCHDMLWGGGIIVSFLIFE